MLKSTGILKYKSNNWLIVDVDPDLAKYYRVWIPKNVRHNAPMYAPHITVINGKHETPKNLSSWGDREGEEIEFEYDNEIRSDETYIWLRVESRVLEEIRIELGLDKCFDKDKFFHITIANTKGV